MAVSILKNALKKTAQAFIDNVSRILSRRKIDDSLKDSLFENLILWDVGVETSQEIIKAFEEKYSSIKEEVEPIEVFKGVLIDFLPDTLNIKFSEKKVSVIIIIGVNGSGKTTLCAKLSKYFEKNNNRKVLLSACDTFRAAAIKQLKIWAERVNVKVIAGEEESDPASIAFDSTKAALSRGYDTLIIDTAGRLHNKENLLRELEKIKRVILKNQDVDIVDIPIVLDATNGVNAILQAEIFTQRIGATSIIITKLDSSFKAGFIFGIEKKLKLPIRFISAGETPDDLIVFDRTEYVKLLFEA
ncbi:MAG: signal recognition particle-docking protein FtsY [Candidatus Hydrogenedentota bacterium]